MKREILASDIITNKICSLCMESTAREGKKWKKMLITEEERGNNELVERVKNIYLAFTVWWIFWAVWICWKQLLQCPQATFERCYSSSSLFSDLKLSYLPAQREGTEGYELGDAKLTLGQNIERCDTSLSLAAYFALVSWRGSYWIYIANGYKVTVQLHIP